VIKPLSARFLEYSKRITASSEGNIRNAALAKIDASGIIISVSANILLPDLLRQMGWIDRTAIISYMTR
jgi:hypothetical protein